MTSKSCVFKSKQKSFFLTVDQVASCCKSYPEQLDATKSIEDYVAQWEYETTLLDQGIEIANCEFCWQYERNGLTSYRQRTVTPVEDTIELWVSNLCNQMCSYCNPKFSSVWENTIRTQGNFVKISKRTRLNLEEFPLTDQNVELRVAQLKEYISGLKSPIVLRVLGGEPLMQLKTLELIQAIDHANVKRVEINTNLNPPTNKFLRWLVEHFSKEKLQIKISLDASPEYNHIPRGLFDQTKFLENLALVQQHNIPVKVGSVISVLNIFDLPNFLPWLDKHRIQQTLIPLNNPDCLSIDWIPKEFKQTIWNKIKHLPNSNKLESYLLTPDSVVDLKLFEQYNYLHQYFTRINIKPGKINNEDFRSYWSWLEQRVNK